MVIDTPILALKGWRNLASADPACTKTEHNRYIQSLRLKVKELKEEDKTKLASRRNLQNDVCEDSVENPDFFNLVELGFWLITR
jgi:hypothetical protein